MILPIGHDAQSSGVRRLPWVTFIIMGICIIVHIFVWQEMNRVEKRLEEGLKKMFMYYFTHPYLELDPEFEKRVFATEEQKEIFKMFLPKETQTPPMDEDAWANEQDELDRLTDEVLNLIDDIPFRKYGMTPAKKSFLTLLTHMFLHGGWLHLILNLLFLYLTGPFIEDVWGRSVYIVFYLLAGLFAGQLFSMHYPNSTVPLIGASGAIAGVMGAFLIRHWRVKLRFLFLLSFIPIGTFQTPAWLILPLWFGLEYFNAQVMDKLFPGGGGGVPTGPISGALSSVPWWVSASNFSTSRRNSSAPRSKGKPLSWTRVTRNSKRRSACWTTAKPKRPFP